MKVGIITIIDYTNYGNRLQNYAIFRLLKQGGYEAETIPIICKEYYAAHTTSKWKRLWKRILPYKIIEITRWLRFTKMERKRMEAFIDFTKKNICMAPLVVVNCASALPVKMHEKEYAYFITGSDQVWNPNLAGDALYFLNFTHPSKRIALMASIGYDSLPQDIESNYAQLLGEMAYISVREESAAQLVQRISGKQVDVMPDPTLLINREEWENLLKKPLSDVPVHYILAFFLEEEPEEIIRDFASRVRMSVVHLNSQKYPQYFAVDPAEFLYLVRNSEYVLTDSFHGTAFSIKFNRQFYTFHKEVESSKKWFTRIENLLDYFELSNRNQRRDKIAKIENISMSHWKKINEKLKNETNRFYRKLDEILNDYD